MDTCSVVMNALCSRKFARTHTHTAQRHVMSEKSTNVFLKSVHVCENGVGTLFLKFIVTSETLDIISPQRE